MPRSSTTFDSAILKVLANGLVGPGVCRPATLRVGLLLPNESTAMDENNLEVIITAGNWQMPGKAKRWNWQVRQKAPPKYLAKGVSSGEKQAAIDAAQGAKAKILARVAT